MNRYLEKLSKPKILLHIIALIGVMFVGDFLSSLPFDIIFSSIDLPYSWMYGVIRVIVCIGFTYLLFNLYTKKFLHSNMEYFRSGKVKLRFTDFLFALVLPLGVIISFIFIGRLSFNSNLTVNIIGTVIFTAICRALKAGILEEILFRGYIMKLIEIGWNKYISIILPSFIFSLVHIPSMQQLSFIGVFLLICSGTLVGIMFSLITYKNNTIWGSALIHAVWNLAMISNIFAFGQEINNKAIFSVVYSFNNQLITGADFGIEASIIAIIGYSIISYITVLLIKKNRK